MREENRTKWVISTLIVIIVILLGVVAYFLWVQPAYNGFINQKQIEAYNIGQTDFLNGMITQLQQAGYVQINLAENQTLYMAPFDPSKVATGQQTASEEIIPTA